MAPASGFGRVVGNARSFVGNALGGLHGWSNLASWTVAGGLAYYLWVKPARQLQREQEVSTYPSRALSSISAAPDYFTSSLGLLIGNFPLRSRARAAALFCCSI
jgi:hypothetical protein